LLPQAALLLIVAPLSPRLAERFGTKLVVGTGPVLAAGGLAFVSQLPVSHGYPHLLAGLVVTAAVATLVPAALDIDTGSLAGDLKTFIAAVARAIATRREDVIDALSMESKRNDVPRSLLRARFLEPRLATVRVILERA
jgi:MFS family permease